MGDSSRPQLRAPALGAAAPSPAGGATPIPRLGPPPQSANVQPLSFRRDSSRTRRAAAASPWNSVHQRVRGLTPPDAACLGLTLGVFAPTYFQPLRPRNAAHLHIFPGARPRQTIHPAAGKRLAANLKDWVSFRLPDCTSISNNVGPVKLFWGTLLRSLQEVFSLVFLLFCIDDHGSFVI